MALEKEVKRKINLLDLEVESLDQILGRILTMRNIIKFEEFQKLSEEDQKSLLMEWRSHDSLKNHDIAKQMGLPTYKLNSLCSRLDLPRRNRGSRDKTVRKEVISTPTANSEVATAVEVVEEVKPAVNNENSSIVPVLAPDVLVYVDKVPSEVLLETGVMIKGYEIVGTLVCNNPEHVVKMKDMAKLFDHDHMKQVFGTGNLITVLYKRLEV